MRTYSPIRSVRPKREHKSGEGPETLAVDRSPRQPYLTGSNGHPSHPHLPDPILRKKAKPIERVDADLRRLMDDMLATMYDAPGIGLAAPQIGVRGG